MHVSVSSRSALHVIGGHGPLQAQRQTFARPIGGRDTGAGPIVRALGYQRSERISGIHCPPRSSYTAIAP